MRCHEASEASRSNAELSTQLNPWFTPCQHDHRWSLHNPQIVLPTYLVDMELVLDGLLLQGLGQGCHVVRAGVAVLAREVEQHRADALRLRCTSRHTCRQTMTG